MLQRCSATNEQHQKESAVEILLQKCKGFILISRAPDQNGIFRLFYMLEIYHSGLETLICIGVVL